MTQFLPTFPAFITRRFSRTSNDDEITNPSSSSPYHHDSAIAPINAIASFVNDSPEEEEISLSSESHLEADSQEIMPQAQTSPRGDSATDLHVREHSRDNGLDLRASGVAQDDAQARTSRDTQHEGDASSSTSQEAAHGLRSAASSVSNSITSTQDAAMDSTLPADDGMADMRARIVDLQNGPASSDEKARLMLALMTERYNASHARLQSPQPLKPRPQSSLTSPDLPSLNGSNHSVDAINLASSPPTSPCSDGGGGICFHLTSEDRQPTYYKRTRRPSDGHGSSGRGLESATGSGESEDDLLAYGCPHYKRNIKLQCSTCSRWYTCRFCHDSVEDHKLVRRETKYMLCMFCNCAQKASGECIECGQSAAWYYCDVCKLWDDNPYRNIYHCDDCGICRVGKGIGKDFYHCKTCGVCLEIGIKESHRCIERSTDCDCPICGDYMFTSPEKVVFMKCGHSIHQKCYGEHILRSYRCPICSRSVLNTEAHFQHLKRLIEMQPMPSHLQDTKAWIYCNDCSAKTTVKYHWLGCACDICDSFNTAMLRILRTDDQDTLPIDAGEFPALEPARLPDTRPPRPVSRGRTAWSSGQTLRSGTSVSAVEAALTAHLAPGNGAQRTMRSASPVLQSQQAPIGPPDSVASDDDDDDDDEVSFWGGSPRPPSERLRSPSSHRNNDSRDTQGGSDASSSGDDEISDNDDNMSEDLWSDESDEMELVGHV